jgi:hypothetical protein
MRIHKSIQKSFIMVISRITRIPVIRALIEYLYLLDFHNSKLYWEERYKKGGNSGSGSYNKLAQFKADIINSFLKKNNVDRAIEFGCGDGNQVSLVQYPPFVGLDVSQTAIEICIKKYSNEPSKSFFIYDPSCFLDSCHLFSADLTLSLDVIYHLVEDEIFDKYMRVLFSSSRKHVIIYSSNIDMEQVKHVKQRKFTTWIETNMPEWKLVNIIRNNYPYDPSDPDNTSISDFYFYQKFAPDLKSSKALV